MSRDKRLGKGLDALMRGSYEDNGREKTDKQFADINSIVPNPDQPRKEFDRESLEELAESIKEKGIIQPILVEEKGDRYMIIAGERRYRAARMAGMDKIPVIIGTFSQHEKLEIALIENIQRKDLTPIEEAMAYNALMVSGGHSQEELAKIVGKKRSTVANSIRLLRLAPEMQEALGKNDISAGHARAILSVDAEEKRKVLFDKIISAGLTVRQAEKMAAELNGEKGPDITVRGSTKSREIEEAEQRFMDRLGTKVSIKGTLSKGKLEISYFSQRDLQRIFEILE